MPPALLTVLAAFRLSAVPVAIRPWVLFKLVLATVSPVLPVVVRVNALVAVMRLGVATFKPVLLIVAAFTVTVLLPTIAPAALAVALLFSALAAVTARLPVPAC